MTTEVLEGEVIPPERAVVPVQPGQALVAADDEKGQERMLVAATRIATALTKMVEAQNLYTTIRGKKYPHVEAWMTIGRMDNVVAREAERPTKNEDGSWEAFVELVRLSDGMVIGRASAMAGAKGDGDWTGRPDHVKRSMAVTRATSRAFRQQYSWIMTLAGYQPTPADEMPPGDEPPAPRSGGFVGTEAHPAPDLSKTPPNGLIGTAIAQGTQDFEIRQTPDGWRLPFRVKDGGKSFIVMAEDALAEALIAIKPTVINERVTVWGNWSDETIPAKGDKREIRYRILHLERIQTPDGILPAPASGPVEQPEFDMAALDAELSA